MKFKNMNVTYQSGTVSKRQAVAVAAICCYSKDESISNNSNLCRPAVPIVSKLLRMKYYVLDSLAAGC